MKSGIIIESSLPNADANSDSNADAVENAGGVLKRATGGKLKSLEMPGQSIGQLGGGHF